MRGGVRGLQFGLGERRAYHQMMRFQTQVASPVALPSGNYRFPYSRLGLLRASRASTTN